VVFFTILSGFLPRIELKKFGPTSLRASVDEDVHATADREVGVTPLKVTPLNNIMRLWGLILRKEKRP
jgi:hypothetical protein